MAPTKNAPTASSPKKAPRVIAGTVPLAQDSGRAETLASYGSALSLMQQGKYEEAHTAFNSMLAASPGDLADRIRMYISACVTQVTKSKANFATDEEHFDYAIYLLNDGHFDDAREQLQRLLQRNSKADYAFYGLAILASITGDTHTCLEHLTEAIRQNPRNRIQARSDSDFQNMADDPRFTELLYPEV